MFLARRFMDTPSSLPLSTLLDFTFLLLRYVLVSLGFLLLTGCYVCAEGQGEQAKKSLVFKSFCGSSIEPQARRVLENLPLCHQAKIRYMQSAFFESDVIVILVEDHRASLLKGGTNYLSHALIDDHWIQTVEELQSYLPKFEQLSIENKDKLLTIALALQSGEKLFFTEQQLNLVSGLRKWGGELLSVYHNTLLPPNSNAENSPPLGINSTQSKLAWRWREFTERGINCQYLSLWQARLEGGKLLVSQLASQAKGRQLGRPCTAAGADAKDLLP